MEKIRGFIKNPLGIIALFVTSIYGIAGLVIGPNFDNLQGGWERQPIIWFIILFPIVILWVFAYLVIKHNEKLYAPKDFDNQEGFLIANGKILTPHKEPKSLNNPELIPVKRKTSQCFFAHGKTNNSSLEYSIIEEAAMKRYADEHDIEIKTDVRISRDLTCDGVAEKDGKLYIFEVKQNYNPLQLERIIESLLRINEAIKIISNDCLRLILILVTEKRIEDHNLAQLKMRLECVMSHVEIINYLRHEF